MKSILIGAMILVAAAAAAASLEQSYLDSRDRYIERFRPTEINVDVPDEVRQQEERARSDLESQLRRIITASAIKGSRGRERSTSRRSSKAMPVSACSMGWSIPPPTTARTSW
jgi:hypothetical protein